MATPVAERHKRDARTRSWRTLRQGAVAAALVAGSGAAAEWLNAGQLDWTTLGVSVATASLMAGLSYLERAYVDPRKQNRT